MTWGSVKRPRLKRLTSFLLVSVPVLYSETSWLVLLAGVTKPSSLWLAYWSWLLLLEFLLSSILVNWTADLKLYNY